MWTLGFKWFVVLSGDSLIFFIHSFIHLFSVDNLQDTEIVIFIIIQEKNKTAA
jgi:hypothetical protein